MLSDRKWTLDTEDLWDWRLMRERWLSSHCRGHHFHPFSLSASVVAMTRKLLSYHQDEVSHLLSCWQLKAKTLVERLSWNSQPEAVTKRDCVCAICCVYSCPSALCYGGIVGIKYNSIHNFSSALCLWGKKKWKTEPLLLKRMYR